jgi:isopentenyldiphosphate isomerase
VVDENDNPIGAESEEIVHSSPLWHRGVHVFVLNSRGELLLQIKKDENTQEQFIDCSVSEHVNYGESYEEAAIRGLRRAYGIEISPENLEELLYFRMKCGENDYMICKLFACLWNDEIKPKEDIAGIFWVVDEQLETLLKSNYLAVWLREILNWFLGRETELKVLRETSSD